MPANYEQPKDVVKRTRFFDGQFLKDQDFIDDQKYHLDRQRRPHRFLRISGICEGLSVIVDDNQVKVTSGTALDSQGRLIVLSDAFAVDLQKQTGDVDIFIAYGSEESDMTQPGSDRTASPIAVVPGSSVTPAITGQGGRGATRWWEKPRIEAVKEPSALMGETPIWLGRVTVTASEVLVTNLTDREYAGIYLPSGANSFKGPILRSGGNPNPRLAILTGDLKIQGTTADENAAKLDVRGTTLTERVNIGNGLGVALQKIHLAIGDNDTGFNQETDGELAIYTDSFERCRIDKKGNVGIGTLKPAAKLHVGDDSNLSNSNLQVDGNANFKGNVGIGTATPTTKLDVKGTIWGGKFNIGNGIGVADQLILLAIGDNDTGFNSQGDGELAIYTDSFERCRIDKKGNVGIGTLKPAAKLHVGDDSNLSNSNLQVDGNVEFKKDLQVGGKANFNGNVGICIGADPKVSVPGIHLTIGDNDTGFKQQTDGELAIYTDNVERCRINKMGRVGIRTINPTIDLAIGDSSTGFNQQGDGELAIYTNGSEKFRVNSIGNVGIGTSTPATKLDVKGTIWGGKFNIGNGIGVALQPILLAIGDHDTGFNQKDDGELEIHANGAEKCRINSRGFGIGTTDPKTSLDVKGTIRTDCIVIGSGVDLAALKNGPLQNGLAIGDNDTGFKLEKDGELAIYANGSERCRITSEKVTIGLPLLQGKVALHVEGNISCTGSISGLNVYNSNASDIRFKTNLRPLQNSLDKIMQLQGTRYEWGETGLQYFTRHIPDRTFSGATEAEDQQRWATEKQKAYESLSGDQIGLIAQDVESVFPELVQDDEEGYKSVRYQHLTAILVEAIKEQNALIQTLSAKVAALEAL